MAITGGYGPTFTPPPPRQPVAPENNPFSEVYQQNRREGLLNGTIPMRSSGDFMTLYQLLQDQAWNQTGTALEQGYAQLAEQTRQALEMMNSRPRNQGIYLYGY